MDMTCDQERVKVKVQSSTLFRKAVFWFFFEALKTVAVTV